MEMEQEELDLDIKVLVVGNGGVGKSSLIRRYCKDTFTDGYKKTIGVDFLEKQMEVDGQNVRMMLWDTAGQEEFNALTRAYYRGANACVLAFSTVDINSFKAVSQWRKQVTDECGPDIAMVVVQNKMDLAEEDNPEQVSLQEGETLAKNLKMRLHRISVKNNDGVRPVFEHLCKKHLESLKKQNQVPETRSSPGHTGLFRTSTEPSNDANNNQPSVIQLRPSKSRTTKKKSMLSQKCMLL